MRKVPSEEELKIRDKDAHLELITLRKVAHLSLMSVIVDFNWLLTSSLSMVSSLRRIFGVCYSRG